MGEPYLSWTIAFMVLIALEITDAWRARSEGRRTASASRVPDGRLGEVIGLYPGEVDTVLVGLGNGDIGQFVPADLRPPNG